jgi:hypothetical protein
MREPLLLHDVTTEQRCLLPQTTFVAVEPLETTLHIVGRTRDWQAADAWCCRAINAKRLYRFIVPRPQAVDGALMMAVGYVTGYEDHGPPQDGWSAFEIDVTLDRPPVQL